MGISTIHTKYFNCREDLMQKLKVAQIGINATSNATLNLSRNSIGSNPLNGKNLMSCSVTGPAKRNQLISSIEISNYPKTKLAYMSLLVFF